MMTPPSEVEINFLSFLRKEKGLFHFNLYYPYRTKNVEKTLNEVADSLQIENHLRNLEALWDAFTAGEKDISKVILPFPNEKLNHAPKKEIYCSSYDECCMIMDPKKVTKEDNRDSESDYEDMPPLVEAD